MVTTFAKIGFKAVSVIDNLKGRLNDEAGLLEAKF